MSTCVSRTLGSLAVLVATVLPAAAQSTTCPSGLPPGGQLGIGLLQCVGGECSIFGEERDGYIHRFTTEPRVRQIDPQGPAANVLRDGDAIVAVDGALITSAEGGRRLARLRAGVPIDLRVRRDQTEQVARLVPVQGCASPRLVVTDSPTVPESVLARLARPERAASPIEFGVVLACGECGWRPAAGGGVRWHATQLPRVLSVDADGPAARAGLRPGDVLMRIDGLAMLDDRLAIHLGQVAPGQPVSVTYRRGAELRSTTLTPRAATTARHL